MRTRAAEWFLLGAFGALACTPSTPRRPPGAARARDVAPVPPSDVAPALPTPTATPTPPPDAGNAPPDAGNGAPDAGPPRPTTSCTPRGPENTAAACANRLDDDCDTQVDCADNDCASTPGCRAAGAHPATGNCAPRGAENTAAACANHLDDDCDGQIDCADNDCLSARDLGCEVDASVPRTLTTNCAPRGPENTAAACANHLDDDCDGQIDCADNDCAPPAVTACPPRPAAPAQPAAPARR